MTPETSILKTQMSVRAIRSLDAYGVKTVQDIMDLTNAKGIRGLLMIPNFGRMSLDSVVVLFAKIQTPKAQNDWSKPAAIALWQIANPHVLADRQDLIDIAQTCLDKNEVPQ
jgi:DNA-directed RNA polymerase alpha subunit